MRSLDSLCSFDLLSRTTRARFHPTGAPSRQPLPSNQPYKLANTLQIIKVTQCTAVHMALRMHVITSRNSCIRSAAGGRFPHGGESPLGDWFSTASLPSWTLCEPVLVQLGTTQDDRRLQPTQAIVAHLHARTSPYGRQLGRNGVHRMPANEV